LMYNVIDSPALTIIANRYEVLSTGSVSSLGFAKVTGGFPFYAAGFYINFNSVPFNVQFSVQGITDVTGSPDVELLGIGWSGQSIPPSLGTFSRLAVGGIDGNGSISVSGGLNTRIKRIYTNYTPVQGDYTILAQNRDIVITLPVYGSTQSNIAASYLNQVLQIKNISGGRIRVVGDIFDGELKLRNGESYILQTDGFTWMVFGKFKGKDDPCAKKEKKKGKCCH